MRTNMYKPYPLMCKSIPFRVTNYDILGGDNFSQNPHL